MLADGLLMERRRTYKIIFMLQVIGTARSKDTQKAIRYLKERSLPFQFVDLGSRTLSEKEWKSLLASVSDASLLVDTASAYYRKNGYEWREYNPVEELIMHPELLKQPVLRNGGKVVCGWDSKAPEVPL